MSSSHRYPRSAAAVTALGLLVMLFTATSPAVAQTAATQPVRPASAVQVNHVDQSAYPAVTATVSVTTDPADALVPDGAFSVRNGSDRLPVTVKHLDLSDLNVVLVVDPGPKPELGRAIRAAASRFVESVLPRAAVTVVAGGPQPKLVGPSTHSAAQATVAVQGIASAPADTVGAIALALNQSVDPAKTVVVAVSAGAGSTAAEAGAVAAAADAAQVPVKVLMPGTAAVPTQFGPLDSSPNASVTAAPTLVSVVTALARLQADLSSRYEIAFQAPDDASTLVLNVAGAGVRAEVDLAIAAPAGGPSATGVPSSSPGPTGTSPVKTAADSTSDAVSWQLPVAIGLASLLLVLGLGLLVVRKRRGTRAAGHLPSGAPEAFEPDGPYPPSPPSSYAVSGPAPTAGAAEQPLPDQTEAWSTPQALGHQQAMLGGMRRLRDPDGPRVDLPGPPLVPGRTDESPPTVSEAEHAPQNPVFRFSRKDLPPAPPVAESVAGPSPATGKHRSDRQTPAPVVPDPVARNRPGARWWMYQRPDTGHQPGPRSSGGAAADKNGADDPDPDANASSIQGDPAPAWTNRLRSAEERNFTTPLTIGAIMLLAAAILGHWVTDAQGPSLVFFGGIFFAVGIGRLLLERHPDEPWIAKFVIWGVVAKLVMAYIRYSVIVAGFEQAGDTASYDGVGKAFVRFWNGEGPNPRLVDLRQTNFLRWFTGVVYYIFGSNYATGFLVFGLIAVIGSYLWYRATVDAVPFINKRLYLGLVMFVPSIVYWPAVIGKEALMQFGIGVMAVGTGHVLRTRLFRGLLICAAGGWVLWIVRPHVLAIVAVSGGAAYLVGRVRSREGAGNIITRPIGIVAIAFLVAFTVNQGAQFLGLKDLSLNSIQTRLSEQTVTTTNGRSSFENDNTKSLSPLSLPKGAITVLLRPFPWETENPIQLLASAECVFFGILLVIRLNSLRVALAQARQNPFLIYCWIIVMLYSMAFSSFANFGLLTRQRSLVLPAIFVLVAVDPERVTRPARLRAQTVPRGRALSATT